MCFLCRRKFIQDGCFYKSSVCPVELNANYFVANFNIPNRNGTHFSSKNRSVFIYTVEAAVRAASIDIYGVVTVFFGFAFWLIKRFHFQPFLSPHSVSDAPTGSSVLPRLDATISALVGGASPALASARIRRNAACRHGTFQPCARAWVASVLVKIAGPAL